MRGPLERPTNVTLLQNFIREVHRKHVLPTRVHRNPLRQLGRYVGPNHMRFRDNFPGVGETPIHGAPQCYSCTSQKGMRRFKTLKPALRVGAAQTPVGQLRTFLRKGPFERRGRKRGIFADAERPPLEGDYSQNVMPHLVRLQGNGLPLFPKRRNITKGVRPPAQASQSPPAQ